MPEVMDLENMRSHGVRSITAYCLDCLHKADINLDEYPAHLAVKSFERRVRCSQCGSKRCDVRPAWHESQYFNPKV